MAAELREGQKLKRRIKIWGVDYPVIVAMTREGLEFRLEIKGARANITQTWPQILGACRTPDNVPSFLEGQPTKYLQYLASQATKNKLKKLEREGQ